MAMFGAQEKEGAAVAGNDTAHANEDTIIGKTIKIEGDLVSDGDIIVEGEVVGTLKTEKTLRVGQGAKVSADVKAQTAYISGDVKGNLEIQDRIELSDTARVTGDVAAKTVSIQAGAQFNGRCLMSTNGMPIVTAESKENDSEDEKSEEGEE